MSESLTCGAITPYARHAHEIRGKCPSMPLRKKVSERLGIFQRWNLQFTEDSDQLQNEAIIRLLLESQRLLLDGMYPEETSLWAKTVKKGT